MRLFQLRYNDIIRLADQPKDRYRTLTQQALFEVYILTANY